jgi:hypothetical protein
VHVHRVPNGDDDLLQKHQALAWDIPGAEWVLICDADELFMINKPTIREFVDAVEAEHGTADVIQFRWYTINHMEPWCWDRPIDVLTARAPISMLDNLKSMGRVSSTVVGNVHAPIMRDPQADCRLVADGTRLTLTAHEYKYNNHFLRLEKRPTFESGVLHLFVRSLADHFTKALNSRVGMRRAKGSLEQIAQLINTTGPSALGTPREQDKVLFRLFKLVGEKATQMLRHDRVDAPTIMCMHNLTAAAVRERVLRLLAQGPRGPAHRTLPYCVRSEEEAAFFSQLEALGVPPATWGDFAAVLSRAYPRHASFVLSHEHMCSLLKRCGRCELSGELRWAFVRGTDCNRRLGTCVSVRARPWLRRAGLLGRSAPSSSLRNWTSRGLRTRLAAPARNRMAGVGGSAEVGRQSAV